MKRIFGILFLVTLTGLIYAQESAYETNSAINNVPSLTRANTTTILKGYLNTIPESSGLIYTSGSLWTFEDSGNNPWIYSIDTSNAAIIQTVIVDNFPNTDWEDITADEDFIYIGDFGNNNGNRTDLKVLKIAKSDINDAPIVYINAQAISFNYLDQEVFTPNNETNFDCESLISKGDSLYLFTKNHADYYTRVYALPKNEGSYTIAPLTSYNVSGMVCGADYNVATNKVVLIGYEGHKLNPFLFILDGFQGNNFFAGNKEKTTIGNNYTKWQTEGVCFANSEHIFISCESTSDVTASLYSYELNQQGINGSPEITTNKVRCFPNPAISYLDIQSGEAIQEINLYNICGQLVYHTNLNQSAYCLALNGLNLTAGFYQLEIHSSGKILNTKIQITK